MARRKRLATLGLFTLLSARLAGAQTPVGTAFVYQGELNSAGAVANGVFDMQFALYDAVDLGSQVGSTLTHLAVLVDQGRFAVTLDFGVAAFSGSRRWLEVGVRPAGSGAYVTLSPRQELTATPGALWSGKAGDAASLGGVGPSGFVLQSGLVQIGQGGTGAASAAPARGNLQVAKSGANADITSVAGLLTPLGVSQGGTGSTTSAAARTALNAQARVSGTCPVGQHVRSVNADGTTVCGADADTNSGGTVQSVTAGAGLAGGPITTTGALSIASGGVTSPMFADGSVGLAQIDSSQIQRRIASVCPADRLLRAVNADGSLDCFERIDPVARVANVTAGVADGVYPTGSTIPILVLFSKPVIVQGTPSITLETGAADAAAAYAFGSPTNLLVFNYTIASGHQTSDLDYVSSGALLLNGGTVSLLGTGPPVSLDLPAPGTAGSIAYNRNIVIDGVAPGVANVTSATPNGSYTTGAVIEVSVAFSEPVTVLGAPTLTLETGPVDAIATYGSGSGTSSLTFSYVVAPPHTSTDLDYASTGALALNGGAIRDSAGNNASTLLPPPGGPGSLAFNKNLVVLPDTVAPTVTNVTSSAANGSYGSGATLALQVAFSESVIVTGAPTLTLETGALDGVATYASGSGSNTLVFNYVVAAGHTSADLDYVATTSLALNGGTIRDSVSNGAILTLPAPGTAGSLGANKALTIDGVAPIVTNVTSLTPNGTYGVGIVIPIRVTFSKVVDVVGTPRLTLETGPVDAVVNYVSGTGTNTLLFNYTTAAGDTTPDLDYASPSALALNGGSIRDAVLNNATLGLPLLGAPGSLGANKAIVIDGVAPTVTSVTSTLPNGVYAAGAVIPIQVTFSEAVTLDSGAVQLTLAGASNPAIYVSGSGTSTLLLNYAVSAGDNSADLDYAAINSLALNGGTLRDAVSNNAVLTLPAPGAPGSLGANKDIAVDTTNAVVVAVNSTAPNGAYGLGAVIPVQVVFSEPVLVTGTPRVTLETGTTDALVSYSSGSGTNTLTFNYTVAAGHTAADLDYTSTSALALNGGTIRDPAANNAALALPSPGAVGSLGSNRNIVIDTTGPTVVSVTSPMPDGHYGPGQLITVQVVFSETVVVTGTPTLTLETGAVDSVVACSGGSGTATLLFSYTVGPGHASPDLDYAGVLALALGGGTIRDAAQNNAQLTLPPPGLAGSLGFNKNLIIP